MAEVEVGYYDLETANDVLDAIATLRASGLLLRGEQITPPEIQARPIFFRNDSGETIPPFSVLHVTGYEKVAGRHYFIVDKYDEAQTTWGGFLFSGPREVADDAIGVAQRGPFYKMQGDGSTVTVGHLWGPVDDSWEVADNGGPWIVCGEDDIEDDVVIGTLDTATVYGYIVTTQITARAGTALGSGVVTLKNMNTVFADGQTGITVKSYYTTAIAVNATGMLSRGSNGRLMVLEEDC